MSRARLTLLAILATAAAVVVPTSAFGGARTSATHTVTLKNISFHPASLTIHRGDSVKWLWRDEGIEHNVTFHGFHSRTQGAGSYTVRFTRRGTFNYRCTIHASQGMVGKVVVR
jgi:plastocyanin